MTYWEIFLNGYKSYATYLWNEITNPSFHSYFYWLIAVSILFFTLEVLFPWRKNQKIIRKDFWLDAFYMFFNFFIFSLIVYNAASDVVVNFIQNLFKHSIGIDLAASNPLRHLPYWAILLVGFVIRDFVQWWTHRLLHSTNFLWKFHKVHHSVKEMGFAAHLRFHWMETVVYRSIEYLPLALLGLGLYDFFIIHIFTLSWGHFNHSNLSVKPKYVGLVLGILIGLIISTELLDIQLLQSQGLLIKLAFTTVTSAIGYFGFGPIMPYLFNSPEMHIWHHSYHLPQEHRQGVNFGLTLAIWDYVFKTAYIPNNGRDIELGFTGVEHFPSSFIHQSGYGIVSDQDDNH